MKNVTVKKKFTIVSLMILAAISIAFVGFSFSDTLENDVEVEPDTELTYYLNINYDGVDVYGTESSDTTVAQINSSTISVEDKIPDGLTFTGFVTTEDGSIGAVQRSDSTIACVGKVIDDTNEESVTEGTWNDEKTEYTYHGLHYDASTRTVSFKVKNLQAGCVLTVGIITTTPETIDDPDTTEVVETRRDFYNYAVGKEGTLTKKSNTVHAFMGSETVSLYSVTYQYTGDVPSNAPDAPTTAEYAEGASVGIANDVSVTGYKFIGWTQSSDDTTAVKISDGSFTMPASDVTFVGSFEEIKNTYSVTYVISGNTPDGYVLPTTKTYYEGETVTLDVLEKGDVFNGYRFLGWETSDVTISDDGDFEMPASNVTLTGSFELVTYQVIYKFYDTVLPDNADILLPETVSYRPGDIVTLATISDVEGYVFLGWYKEDNFTMPSEDVTIYGEWMKQSGTFAPEISESITTTKNYYREGDVVTFEITVKNTAEYGINSVVLKDNTEGSKFTSGTGYTVESDHFVTIDSLDAGSSIIVYAQYTVTSDDTDTVTDEVEIKGALADKDYYTLEDKTYKASVTFNIESKLKLCKVISGTDVGNSFNFKISSSSYETYINLEKGECKTIYLEPDTYTIDEIEPQEYEISSVTGSITKDGSSLTIEQGKTYTVTYTNKFIKKGFWHSFSRVVNTIKQGV